VLVPKLVTTLKDYTREQFSRDVIAGVIVGIVALPLAIAFAHGHPGIDLVGITLDIFGPGGVQGPENIAKASLTLGFNLDRNVINNSDAGAAAPPHATTTRHRATDAAPRIQLHRVDIFILHPVGEIAGVEDQTGERGIGDHAFVAHHRGRGLGLRTGDGVDVGRASGGECEPGEGGENGDKFHGFERWRSLNATQDRRPRTQATARRKPA